MVHDVSFCSSDRLTYEHTLHVYMLKGHFIPPKKEKSDIIYSLYTCFIPVWVNFFLLNTKEDIFKKVGQ